MNEQEIERYNQAIEAMEAEVSNANTKQRQMANAQLSLFGSPTEDNLIRWQLDLKEDLDRIYHLLKGHRIQIDASGNTEYIEPTDTNLKPFNEFGVQLLMNIMSFYLNRNTILSNYDEETINWKVLDFGFEISDLIFNRYEEMGLDTQEKIKMYPMIVKELVDTVHSAYLRALNGGERESLRTARTVTQNEPLFSRQSLPSVGGSQDKFSLFRPSTWMKR